MNRLPALALALAASSALAPVASAHLETFSQATGVSIGPYSALLQPRPDPVFAHAPLSVATAFSRASDGAFVTHISAHLEIAPPEGEIVRVEMSPDGTGYLVGATTLGEPGTYSVRLVASDGDGEYANETTILAYPNLPFRIRTADPDQPDPLSNRSYTFAVSVVDNETLTRPYELRDLTLTIERWSDDHETLLGSDSKAMTRGARPGVWNAEYLFSATGMAHLRFSSASGGFKPDDVPILHVYAKEPTPDPASARKTDLPSPLALVAAAAGVALLAGRRSR